MTKFTRGHYETIRAIVADALEAYDYERHITEYPGLLDEQGQILKETWEYVRYCETRVRQALYDPTPKLVNMWDQAKQEAPEPEREQAAPEPQEPEAQEPGIVPSPVIVIPQAVLPEPAPNRPKRSRKTVTKEEGSHLVGADRKGHRPESHRPSKKAKPTPTPSMEEAYAV